jgi:cell division initiation protein
MLTPLQIQNQDFKKSFRGFNIQEVKQFLFSIAETMDQMLEENQNLRQEVTTLKQSVFEWREREKILKDTLITAQQLKQEVEKNAKREAQLLVQEGQIQAETIVDQARQRLGQADVQLRDLSRIRNELFSELSLSLMRFQHFLEGEKCAADEADKIRMVTLREARKPRPSTTSSPDHTIETPLRSAKA